MNRDKAEKLLAGMTPPDSGDYLRVRTIRNVENPMKPDSGESEARDDGRRWSYSCFAKVHVRCLGGSCACKCHIGVFVPLDLAQRILAALESLPFEQLESLADELRAVVERKT